MAYFKGTDKVVVFHTEHRGVYNLEGELQAIGVNDYREIFFDTEGSDDVKMLFEREFDSEGNVLPEDRQDWGANISREAYSMLSEFFKGTNDQEEVNK